MYFVGYTYGVSFGEVSSRVILVETRRNSFATIDDMFGISCSGSVDVIPPVLYGSLVLDDVLRTPLGSRLPVGFKMHLKRRAL